VAWQMDFETGLIEDGDRIVGSVANGPKGNVHVEIIWDGPTGDIVFEGPRYCAAAFVQGVESTINAVNARISALGQ
jgi:hypothetical protein